MEDNFDQLKVLKQMLEQGAISDSEFASMKADLLKKSMAKDGVKSAQKPNAFSLFFKKYKWLFLGIFIFNVVIIVALKSMQKDPIEEANKLAVEYCNCQNQNNAEYISQLSSFIANNDSSKIEFANVFSEKLDELELAYMSDNINQNVESCFRLFEMKKEKVQADFKKGSSDFTDFEFAYNTRINEDSDLNTQKQEISDLLNLAYMLAGNVCYEDQEDLEYRKQNIGSKLSNFYTSISENYFDAFDYFSYNVERYITRKNLNPTDINLIIQKPDSDYQTPKWKVVDETLDLKSCTDNIEIWEYAAEFSCFRPSREQWQISNVRYEIKFNSSNKITSYRESKIEKTQYFTTEEMDAAAAEEDENNYDF